jgi:Uma2 family endonuclease
MGTAKHARVSADEFLEWVSGQTEGFELVEGYLIEVGTGATQGHNVVITNIVSSVGPQAKIGGCRTTARDTAVQTDASTVRYPDVVVDCGPADLEATVAESPTLIVEVSSPGTASVDTKDKVDEYQRHPAVRLIMVVEPSIVSVKLYRRDGDGVWNQERYDALDGVIDMPEIRSVLTLAEIYDTLLPRLHLIGAVESPKPRYLTAAQRS